MIHPLVSMLSINKARKSIALLRVCPKCRSKQMTAEKKLNDSVICKKCGAEIQPKTRCPLKQKN